MHAWVCVYVYVCVSHTGTIKYPFKSNKGGDEGEGEGVKPGDGPQGPNPPTPETGGKLKGKFAKTW